MSSSRTRRHVNKYGTQYGFDPLMLAAQGYQESQLNQNAKSNVGAIGVMQLMPLTGAQMKVGDIHLTEANIHAGTNYMNELMSTYFGDAKFSEGNRPLFAFAAYNCGPGMSRGHAERPKRESSIRINGYLELIPDFASHSPFGGAFWFHLSTPDRSLAESDF